MASSHLAAPAPRSFLLAAAIAGALLFSGCTPTDAPTSSPTPEPTSGTTTEPSATAAPTDEPIVSEPVDATCDTILTPDDIYAYNPNVSLVADGAPKPDSKAGVIAGMNGLTCQWVNNSSNQTIDVGVAKLTEDQLTALMNLAVTESTQVPTYGAPPVEGYFTVIGTEGEAQVFSGSYWIALRSVAFFEPGDAEQLAEAVLEHLPA